MIHLRIRTEYSFSETFAPIPRVVKRLKELGVTHAAITDQSTFGHVKFFQACKKEGIHPILGVEVCVSDDDQVHNMTILAKNQDGLKELYRLTSKSHTQHISDRAGRIPRLYQADLLRASDNLIFLAGEMLDGEFLAQVEAVIDLAPGSRILNAKKRMIAEKYKLRTIGVADNYYAYEEDRDTFELACRGGLKPSPQHIIELEVNLEAELLAKDCEGLTLPHAPMIRAYGNLEQLCREGIKFRDMKWTDEYETRLMYELELIRSKDFESYFIVVADMVQYAKKHMLVGPSRGSAAGSLVCYLARITEIDPIPPKLYFERFIDVSRTDMPDIDLDFPDNKRAMVFDYMAEKYGINNIAHIGTVSVFKPRSALIQVCKKLNIPPSATGAVKAAMIERSSADIRASNCLLDTFETTPSGISFLEQYPQARAAALIEGHASHTGVHAAGLLICNDEITNYATVDANGIAHVEKGAAETLGLLKIDVLGLRTLSILEDSGLDIDWYNLKFDDPLTFKIFNDMKLSCVFQFEGNAMNSTAKQLNFHSIKDIDAVTALARPGPYGSGVTNEYIERSRGKKYEAIHPLVEKQMSETYGLPVYQEQTLAIVREIGKFDWKDTAMIRKAMSKSLGDEFFGQYYARFKEGAATLGISEDQAKKTWDLINAMGSWQMNKAHTYSYAVISYWCAYLKAHFPLEFTAANLRNAKDEDSAVRLLREMKNEGIEYVAFDIERSEVNWSVKDGVLIGGFMNLKGFGEAKAKKLIEARAAGKLTQKQRDDAAKAENVFADITPINTKFGEYYSNPNAFGISGEVTKINDITDEREREYVFIGELLNKNPRSELEEVNIKKRAGKPLRDPHLKDYFDFRLKDDTGQIGCRISRWDYERLAKPLLNDVPIGAVLLVRAMFFKGILFAFIKKWKVLE